MTTSHLPRRAVVGVVLAAGLIGSGVVAFADDAAPAATGCPATYTDPAGDSGFGDPATNPITGDDDLDIVGVTHSVDNGMLTTAVKVVALNESGPANAFADRFITDFTVAKKVVEVTAERDFSGFGANQASASVDGTAVTFPVKLVEDIKGSTISAVMSAADLEKAIGVPLAGQSFSAMSSSAHGVYPSNASPGTFQPVWDDATAPTTAAYVFGTGCGGTAAPVVAPTEAPAPPAVAPAGGGDPSKLPNADCFLAKDPKGDAHVLNGNVPNDPDVDLTSMTLGSDAKNLYAYLKVDKLAAGPMIHDGHRFYVNFTFNKHTFTAAGSAFKDAQSADFKDGLAQTGQVAHVTQLAVDGVSSATDPERVTGNGPGFVDSGLKYVFDEKTSTVTAILPIADLEKYGKAPSAGAALTSVYGGAYGDAYAVAQPADAVPDGATSPDTSKLTWAVSDNHCFPGGSAVASPLSSVGALKAQYGDVAAVAAKLVDAAGAPVAGKTLTFALGASKATGVTGADGVAKAALTVKDKAGKRTLKVTGGDASTSVPFTVLVEKAALKATGSKGTITATLADDDKKPVVGQAVTFTAGSKKATVKTDAKGVAKAAGFAPGTTVKVTYAGAPGMYSGAAGSAKA